MTTEELKAACERIIDHDENEDTILEWYGKTRGLRALARAFLAQQEALRVARNSLSEIWALSSGNPAISTRSSEAIARIREIEGE